MDNLLLPPGGHPSSLPLVLEDFFTLAQTFPLNLLYSRQALDYTDPNAVSVDGDGWHSPSWGFPSSGLADSGSSSIMAARGWRGHQS